ncbi:MAG: hypothetical protein ABH827_00120 [bacterium]
MNGTDGNKPSIPNLNIIKGILAIIFGLVFVIWAYKIIFDMILFIAGAMLIYYGLVILKVKPITDVIDHVAAKIKNILSQ